MINCKVLSCLKIVFYTKWYFMKYISYLFLLLQTINSSQSIVTQQPTEQTIVVIHTLSCDPVRCGLWTFCPLTFLGACAAGYCYGSYSEIKDQCHKNKRVVDYLVCGPLDCAKAASIGGGMGICTACCNTKSYLTGYSQELNCFN